MTELALDRLVDALHAHGSKVAANGRTKAKAQCPAHPDNNPSLSLTQIEGQVLVKCWGGCDNRDVVAALGLGMADLYDERSERYRYDDGRTVHRSYQDGRKTFVQYGVKGKAIPQLYRASRIAEAVKGHMAIFLVEGEKDVHALESRGYTATTAPMGAANFHLVDVSPLKGAKVHAIVDQDEAGAKWAQAVRSKLHGVAESVRFYAPKEGKDAADHVAAGYGLGDLLPYEPPSLTETQESSEELVPERTRRLVAVPAAGMVMRAPRWLYDRRIPCSAITLLSGREGIGKSTISYDFAARITRGELDGKYLGTPRSVGVVATEDAWAEVILPRLVAARADLNRIYRLDSYDEDATRDVVSIPADLNRLKALSAEKDIVFVLLDPLMSVVHSSLDTHKDRELRKALDPLSHFASESGVSVLGLIHVNKSGTTDPLSSIMGSRAFTAVARSILYCIADPDAADQYLFTHEKSNLGRKQPTLQYRLLEAKVELADPLPGEDPVIVTSRVMWGEEDERTARDVMEASRPIRAAGELATRVLAWIAEQGRTVSATELAEAFTDVNAATLRRNLARMTERGMITRPIHGHYAIGGAL